MDLPAETTPIRPAWKTTDKVDAPFQRSPTDFLPLEMGWPTTGRLLTNWNEESERKLRTTAAERDPNYLIKQHVLPVTHLIHCTHAKQAADILLPGGNVLFKGQRFSNDNYRLIPDKHRSTHGVGQNCTDDDFHGLESLGHLIWFGCRMPSNIRSAIMANVAAHHVEGDFMKIKHLDQFATSPLFTGVSMYGNFAFTASTESFTRAINRSFQRSSSPVTDNSNEPEAKHARHDTMACFHAGGTLFYQKEVTYVVVIGSKTNCDKLEEKGFPCLGEDATLTPAELEKAERADPTIASTTCPDAQPAVRVSLPNDQVPVELSSRTNSRKLASIHIKSTVGQRMDFTLERRGLHTTYWENVVFAVATEELHFLPDEIETHLVDHDIDCCQPSLQLSPDERCPFAENPWRMGCHLGGYARKEKLKEALVSILPKEAAFRRAFCSRSKASQR